MTRDQAITDIRGRLGEFFSSRGIDTRKNFRCVNPDHPDKNPSMTFDTKSQRVKCFACGANYDVFDLIGIEHGLSAFNDKLSRACEIFHLTIDGGADQTRQGVKETQKQDQPQDFTSFYRQARQRIGETDYPQRRGLSDEVVARFGLGFVREWRHPKALAAPPSPRLIVPTSDYSYLAIDTRPDLTDEQRRYSKSNVRIFNAIALREATKPIFVTEAELDALSVLTVGGEAVALGSASYVNIFLTLVEEQRPKQILVIALDNDPAGEDAADKITNGLRALNVPFYRTNPYGSCKDANEALTSDRKAFMAAIANAESMAEETNQTEEDTKQATREAYLRTSAAFYIDDFRNTIAKTTPAILTGFKKLDMLLDDGLHDGLYILGGISSLGKTSFVLQIIDQIAAAGTDVILFSLEMARHEIMAKSISRGTFNLDYSTQRRNAKTMRGVIDGKRYGLYNQEERALIDRAIRVYTAYGCNIYIIEGMGNVGVTQIREGVEKHLLLTGKKPVVVVDYLQMLAPYSERGSDKQNVDKAVLELKRMSRDYGIPVMVVSSLNRSSYKEKIAKEAFKESGGIEYTADVLLGLQFTGAGEKTFDVDASLMSDPREIEIRILKNRNGRTGDNIPFRYFQRFNYFEEAS